MTEANSQWIDTHLHLLYPQRLHYDWTADAPALCRAFLLETYWDECRTLGVGQSLHMEVDVRENEIAAETDLVAELAGAPNSPIGGAISACRPESEDQIAFAAFAEQICANPLVKGFRRVLHTMPDGLSQSAHFRANLRVLTSQGHPFDLCVTAAQLSHAYDLAKTLSDSSFVLDHCGIPPVQGDLSQWKLDMARLAALPNVNCKISGIIAYGNWESDALAPIADDLRPIIEHCVEIFGWDRLVWGSDWPVCTLTKGVKIWKDVTDYTLSGVSAAEREALACENAKRIYRL